MARAQVLVAVLAAAAVLGGAAALAAEALPGELTGPAPWPASNETLRGRLAALGLPALKREGTKLHFHAHLDLFVSGKRVVVPAGIGIDRNLRFVSQLHTHDRTGVIHIESNTVRKFTLAHFFGVWGVRFRQGCLGGHCSGGGKALRVYSNGRLVARPRELQLSRYQEIVVAFGTASELPRPIPARYTFRRGL